jgi:hypothetical protein
MPRGAAERMMEETATPWAPDDRRTSPLMRAVAVVLAVEYVALLAYGAAVLAGVAPP